MEDEIVSAWRNTHTHRRLSLSFVFLQMEFGWVISKSSPIRADKVQPQLLTSNTHTDPIPLTLLRNTKKCYIPWRGSTTYQRVCHPQTYFLVPGTTTGLLLRLAELLCVSFLYKSPVSFISVCVYIVWATLARVCFDQKWKKSRDSNILFSSQRNYGA